MNNWREALQRNKQRWKPYMQSLYIDLIEDDNASPRGIHLGFRSGKKLPDQFFKSFRKNRSESRNLESKIWIKVCQRSH